MSDVIANGREAIAGHLKGRKALLEDYVITQTAEAEKRRKFPADCPRPVIRSLLAGSWVPSSPFPDLNAELAAKEAEQIGEILANLEDGGMDEYIAQMTEAWGPARPRVKE